MKTLLNCGCEITVYEDGSGVDIEYCDTHWAAPQMWEALKVYANHNNWTVVSDNDGELQEVAWIGNDEFPWKIAQAAIAKAEGLQ